MLAIPQYLHHRSTEFKDLLQILYSLGFQIQRGCYIAPYSNLVNYNKGAHVDLDGTGWFCVSANGPGTASGVIHPPDDLGHAHWTSDSRLSLTDTTRIGVLEQSYMNTFTYIGDVREYLRPKAQLMPGWHALTGEGHDILSPVGKRLQWLKTQSWWMALEDGWTEAADTSMKIRQVGDIIYLPKWAHTDGRLPSLRPVDGEARKVGSLEEDASRNITGAVTNSRGAIQCYGPAFTGAFTGKHGGSSSWSGNVTGNYNLNLDTSRVVPTATENRVLTRGTTIAINLMSHLLEPITYVTDPV